MKFHNITFLGLVFILLGVLVGYTLETNVNKIDRDILDESNVEHLNEKSRGEFPLDIAQDKWKTILVYMNPNCYTRGEHLEDWHNLSKNIKDRVIIVFTDELIFYIDYLVRVEKRYDEGMYLLKSKKIDEDIQLLKNIDAEEAVFIIDNDRELLKTFKSPGVPPSLDHFLTYNMSNK